MRLFEGDDYEIIARWFEKRGMRCPPVQYFPKVGFIEDLCAAGFLIQTDTPVAIIDFLISNKGVSELKRGRGIESVVDALIKEAKRRGFKSIRATSQIGSVCDLAKRFKFVEVGEFKTFFKEI